MKERDFELIDRYLTGSLSADEKSLWEDRLTDPEFRTLLTEHEEVQKAATIEGREELRALLTSWDTVVKLPQRRRIYYWSAIAASFLVIIAAYLYIRPTQDVQQLASTYLEPYPNLVAPLQKGTDEPTQYEEAFHFYETGYYGKAETAFGSLDSDDEAVQFYSGLTALLDDKYPIAISRLTRVAENPDNRYQAPAKWYLGLALLITDKKKEAIPLISEVAASDTPKADEAAELLEKIGQD